MYCAHPDHGSPENMCSRFRSTKLEGEAVCLSKLKAWALAGTNLPSKKMHKDAWSVVDEAHRAGTLQEHELYDIVVPDTWEEAFANAPPPPPSDVDVGRGLRGRGVRGVGRGRRGRK